MQGEHLPPVQGPGAGSSEVPGPQHAVALKEHGIEQLPVML